MGVGDKAIMRLSEINQADEIKKSRWKYKFFIGFATFLLAIILLLITFGKKFDYCEHLTEIKQIAIYGVVYEIVDKTYNHNTHGIWLKDNRTSNMIYLDLSSDANINGNQSLLWTLLEEGDSVKKEMGGFRVAYKKLGLDWQSLTLGYDESKCLEVHN
jgi:hypothetical protein